MKRSERRLSSVEKMKKPLEIRGYGLDREKRKKKGEGRRRRGRVGWSCAMYVTLSEEEVNQGKGRRKKMARADPAQASRKGKGERKTMARVDQAQVEKEQGVMCNAHDHLIEEGWAELGKEMGRPREKRKEMIELDIGLLLFLHFLLALLFSWSNFLSPISLAINLFIFTIPTI